MCEKFIEICAHMLLMSKSSGSIGDIIFSAEKTS